MKVKIQQFEGPLDLLLSLIEEEKLDVTEISLAHVTEQFLQYMRTQTSLSPSELADWLNIAAKLLVIKSRVLLPSLAFSAEEEQEATDLTWQLYQYKLYKEAAKALRKIESQDQQSWIRHTTFVEKITFYPDPSVNNSTLYSAMRFLAKSLEEITQFPKKILEEVINISEKIEDLQNTIQHKVELKLKDLLRSAKSRTEIIVTFLALLELVKQKILSVEQETIFSEIIIRRRKKI